MAGQPPEPSFQPAERDQGLTQGRPAWQQPSYPPPPPPASPGGQQAYPAPPPPPPSYGGPEQARAAQDPGYAVPDPAYAQPRPQDQGYPQDQAYTAVGQQPVPGPDYQGQDYQDYQAYQGYQAPAYGAPQGQSAGIPQWQAGASAARPAKQRGEKGFLGSLFDFSFSSFVTPKIIKVLYALLTAWTVLVGLLFLILGFRTGGLAGGLAVLIIVEPIFVLLTLGVFRVILEAFMVVFRIYEETQKIREETASKS